jgi:hypothetical protein
MRRIFCKAEESLSRKGFSGRRASPFSLLFPPPHRKSKLREKGPIKIGHFGEAAHAQIDMAKGVSAHRMFSKPGLYLILPFIDYFLGQFESDGFGLTDC